MCSYTEPHFGSIALLTIDMQMDFLDGQPCEIPGTSAVVPVLASTAEAFRILRLPIFHLIRLYAVDGSNAELCRRERIEHGASIVRPGSAGSELVSDLLPNVDRMLDAGSLLSGKPQQFAEREWAIYKPRWGALYQTCLDQMLVDRGIDTLAVAGCNFPNCPRTSIYEASERDYRLVGVEDAISGFYERGRQEMLNIGVVLMTSQELTAKLA